MKLQRESINLLNEDGSNHYKGTWLFYIYDNDPEALEAVEDRLCEMETGSVCGDGHVYTWGDYCDGCPCYNDGFGSGFLIEIEDVDNFKAAWKIAKKVKKNV